MGLGPPVCMKCQVLYTFKHSYGWQCPICEQNDLDHEYLFTCGLDIEELKANERFLRFLKGKIDDH